MNRQLDSLFGELRDAAVPAGMLDDVEQRVWQQISACDALALHPSLRLSFQAISVAAAFLVGILLGVDVAESAQVAQAFLVDDVNLLPSDSGGLRF
jgi:hypothetical protein